MEVSSHALVQHRADAVRFAAGVFTNLSPEHLDYHHHMEDYFEAKALLFTPDRIRVAVVNRSDPWGQRLLERLSASNVQVVTFAPEDADQVELSPARSRFTWDGQPITINLGGRFNVANAVAAAACARALGIPSATIAEGLSSVPGVRGRFESVDAGQPFTVLVDYAHTPDGLAQALEGAREFTTGRLLVVFGAGGDRDHEKRPLMGAVGTRLADLAVVTSDNPRSEDPDAIIAEVVSGAADQGNLVIEADRANAISLALANAHPGDVVLIAGKGHEPGQEIAGRVLPFDDADTARTSLLRILASRREPE
jgi:UDP-N-acetylmuramoyl-L-alanyl-D-glutamate--2,6-diaminopimelate ligase